MQDARKALIKRRKHIAKLAYLQWTRSANAPPDPLLPLSHQLDSLGAVVHHESDDELDIASFATVLADAVPIEVHAWRMSKMRTLLDLLPYNLSSPFSDYDDPDVSRFYLATTCFTCCHRTDFRKLGEFLYMVSLPVQPCCKPKEQDVWDLSCLQYNEDIAGIVGQLVFAAGLDPITTTVDDLQKREARFYCRGCPDRRLARHWLNCVSSFVSFE